MNKLGKSALAIATVMTIALLAFQLGHQQATIQISLQEKSMPRGHLYVVITRADGTVITYETDNIVVTIGKTRVRDFLKDGTSGATNPTKYMSVSNDASPSASWTKLPNEATGSGFVRATGVTAIINATAYNCTYTWTCTIAITLQCGGLNCDPTSNSDNNLFAAAPFIQTAFGVDDTLKLIWVVNAA